MAWITDMKKLVAAGGDPFSAVDAAKQDFRRLKLGLPEAYWRIVMSTAMYLAKAAGTTWDKVVDTLSSYAGTKRQDIIPSLVLSELYGSLLAPGETAESIMDDKTPRATQLRMEAIQTSLFWAWGFGKGVYDIDATVADSVTASDIDEIPVHVVDGMPYDCLFIPYAVNDCCGAFFHRFSACGHSGLSFMMIKRGWPFLPDDKPDYTAGTVDLTSKVDRKISTFIDVTTAQASDPDTFKAYINLLLLLCCRNVDVVGRTASRPGPSFDCKTGQALVTNEPRYWDVGKRQGAALRAASLADDTAQHVDGCTSSHASPRAHVRRAHWHRFWVGPKNDQRIQLMWIAPILVGASDSIVETHHTVA